MTFASKFAGLEELEPLTLTAYRFHTQDPVVWRSEFALRWQNGMDKTGGLAAKPTRLDYVVSYYEWCRTDMEHVMCARSCNQLLRLESL